MDQRYSRQVLFDRLGTEGQEKLAAGTVLIVGCGALGSMNATLLARAGVGRLRVVDRDVVDLTNLHRQVLFDEDDVAAGLPKAEAAARRLRRVNSTIAVEATVADVTPRNVEALVAGVSLVVDGLDNFETRYLLNDACLAAGKPWIYGGVLGAVGMTMNVLPGAGPCLRCLFPEPPPPGTLPTCDTAGVIGPAPAVVASLQSAEACKILVGSPDVRRDLLYVDVWEGSFRSTRVARAGDCPACGRQRYDFLRRQVVSWAVTLCGRNAVQITPGTPADLPLDRLAADLARVGTVSHNGFLLQFSVGGIDMIIFPNGRAIVKGTTDVETARGLYARYVGH
jgi:adenylyltransferase/sulfurtransferase